MPRSLDEFIQRGEVRGQADPLAVRFRDKEGRATPCCGLATGLMTFGSIDSVIVFFDSGCRDADRDCVGL